MWLSLSSCHSAGHFFLHTILSLLTFDDSRSQLPCFFLVSALIILFRSSSYATSSLFFPPRHLFTHLTYLFLSLYLFATSLFPNLHAWPPTSLCFFLVTSPISFIFHLPLWLLNLISLLLFCFLIVKSEGKGRIMELRGRRRAVGWQRESHLQRAH